MTAKARSRPRPSDEDTDGAGEDDGILRIGEAPEEPRYEVLFRLDGKDYEVVANPPASLMLRYMDRVRKWGPNPAVSWLLEQMVGADGYEALLGSPKVTQKDIRRVNLAAVANVMGTSSAPK